MGCVTCKASTDDVDIGIIVKMRTAVSPTEQWKITSNFAGFFPMVAKMGPCSMLEGENEVGAKRQTLALGTPLIEVLTAKDDVKMTFQYKMTEFGGVPLSSYTSTWTQTPDGDGTLVTVKSRMVYTGEQTDEQPKEGQPPSATKGGMKAFWDGSYVAWIEAAAEIALKGNILRVKVSKKTDVSPAQQWKFTGDFAGLFPTIAKMEPCSMLEGENEVGAKRQTLALGTPLSEELTSKDDEKMMFQYSMYEFGGVPLSQYTSTWWLTPDGDGTLVTVESLMVYTGEQTDEPPKETQPPWATKGGMKAFWEEAYIAWIGTAAQLAAQ